MIEVLVLVLIAGVVPALALERSRRHAAGTSRGTVDAVRRHQDFLEGLAAATGTSASATDR